MNSPQYCILCIEDEQTLLSDLQEELTGAGYRVVTAGDAQQALKLLSDTKPDLVLCDVMLGDDEVDGFAIHQYMREHCAELETTPFILLTALGQRSNVLKAKLEGIDDYLVKPVDYDMLLAALRGRLSQVSRLHNYQRRAQDVLLGRLTHVFGQLPGAVLLCTLDGRLLYANPVAESLGGWSKDKQQRLLWPLASKASARQLQEQMQAMVNVASGERRMHLLEAKGGAEGLLVSLLRLDGAAPDDPAIAVFICSAQSRPLPDLESLRLLFGLTQTEAKVALLLGKGLRSEEVAAELRVSANTVAFHLRNVFSKTGVARQTDIVALVLAAGWSIPDLTGAAT